MKRLLSILIYGGMLLWSPSFAQDPMPHNLPERFRDYRNNSVRMTCIARVRSNIYVRTDYYDILPADGTLDVKEISLTKTKDNEPPVFHEPFTYWFDEDGDSIIEPYEIFLDKDEDNFSGNEKRLAPRPSIYTKGSALAKLVF
ncbi:MAG: hypothetical protein ABIB79_05375 [archaeon]